MLTVVIHFILVFSYFRKTIQQTLTWWNSVNGTYVMKRLTFSVININLKNWGCSCVKCLLLKKSLFYYTMKSMIPSTDQMEQIFVTRSGQGILLQPNDKDWSQCSQLAGIYILQFQNYVNGIVCVFFFSLIKKWK